MAKGFNIRAWLGLETRDFRRGLRGAAQSTRGLNKHLRNTGNFLNSIRLAIIGIGIAGMFGTVINTIRKFQTAMARVKVISQATTAEFAEMNKVARQLGRTTIHSASEVADGMKYLSMAGLSADEVVKAIPHTLNMATAGMMDMGRAADVATNLMKGFGYGVESLGAITDIMAHTSRSVNADMEEFYQTAVVIGPLFRRLSLSIEDAAVALGFLADQGIKASAAGMAMSMTLSRLVRQPGEVRKTLRRLGVTIDSTSLSTEGFIGTMIRLRNAGATLEDIAILFGRHWKSMAPFISATREEFDELIDTLSGYEGAAREVAEEGIGPLERSLKLLRSEAEELWIVMGERGLSGAVINITKNLKVIVGWIGKMITKFKGARGIVIAVTTALGFLVNPFTGIIIAIINLLVHWNHLVVAFQNGINAIIEFINSTIKIRTAFRAVVMSFQILIVSIEHGFRMVGIIIHAFIKAWAKMFEGLGMVIEGSLKKAFIFFNRKKAKALKKEGWKLIGEGVKEAFSEIGRGVIREMLTLQNKMINIILDTADKIFHLDPLKRINLSKLRTDIPEGTTQTKSGPLGKQKTGGNEDIIAMARAYQLMIEYLALLPKYMNVASDGMFMFNKAVEKEKARLEELALVIEAFKERSLRGLGHAFRRLAGVIGDTLGESVAAWLDFLVTMAEGIADVIRYIKEWSKIQKLQSQFEVANNAGITASNAAMQVSKYPFGWLAIPAIIATVLSMFAAIPKAKSLAKGGLAFGRTFAEIGEYPGARSNPEVIAPLNKLKEYLGTNGGNVRFEIEGNKLVGVLNNHAERNKRFR